VEIGQPLKREPAVNPLFEPVDMSITIKSILN